VATLPKALRLAEVFRRLSTLPALTSRLEARAAFDRTLNEVEDQFSGTPNNPGSWRTDGRMYPVQDDRAEELDGHPGVWSYMSLRHETLIAANGAIEVRDVIKEEVVFTKLGADGKGVWS
jgi:hypothetical protein